MRTRPLVRFAAAEALLVLALGIAVLMRGDEAAPPTTSVDLGAPQPRAEQERARREAAASQPVESTASRARPLPLAPPSPAEVVDAGDPLGLVLYGTLQDQDGNPLTNGFLSLTADTDSTLRLQTSGGRFATWSLSGVPPGSYRLRCQATGCRTIDEEVNLLPTPRVQRRDFRLLRALAIKVKFDMPEEQRAALVRDRHAVLATVDALPERIAILDGGNIPFQTLGSWQENWDGSLGKDYAGQILLQRAPPLYLSVFLGPIRLQSRHLAEMCDEVTFPIDAASLREATGGLRLRLVDAGTGLPVVAAFVNVAEGSSSPDERGVLERSDLAPGRQDLTVWTEGRYATVSRTVAIRGGERLDLGDLRLEPSRSLHGIVVDAADHGVVAYVHAQSLRDPEAPVMNPILGAQSRADGRFDLAGLGEARYLVRAVTADGARLGLATAEAGATSDVRIVLLPTFPVQFTSRLGAYEECRVIVRTLDGHAFHSERLMGSRPARLRLPEGTYLLDLRGRVPQRSFTVTQQGATVEVP